MKDKAIEKLDEIKSKIEDDSVEVNSIDERSTDSDSGSIKVNYSKKDGNNKRIGFK